MQFRPPLFLLTGLVWVLLSALLGIGLFLSVMVGRPVPSVLRLIHVHAVLVSGIAQIVLGGLITGRDRPASHPVLYVFINAGTLGMLIGFGTGEYRLVGTAGVFVLLAFVMLAMDTLRQNRDSVISPALQFWFYGVALVALLAGLVTGEGIALHLLPQAFIPQTHLAHIHLPLLGFITLTILGATHQLFPTVLNARLHSPLLARLTFFLLPAGIVALVTGFLLSHLWIEIGAGIVLLTGTGLSAYNMLRSWLDAGRPSNTTIDHFLIAIFFLVLAVLSGILVAVNHLWDPPKMPFGNLHLVAYTHLALVGFIVQTIFGALSYLLPIMLALSRVKSNKKRVPYLVRLSRVMDRWRAVQVGSLSVGTLGLAVVAALVWQFPLSSVPVQIASWLSGVLLVVGIGVFVAKAGLVVVSRPER
jgi:hypothetical protein